MLEPILSALDFKALIRVKANLNTMTPDHYYTGMHTTTHTNVRLCVLH